jgi:glycosyltransferase involved in cell wall biosynthesis
MITDKIEIITVNYNTPDLIDRLIKSVREFEGDYQIRIIDGSDAEPFKSKIVEVCEKYNNVVLQQQGWNIHHGRGLDLGLSTSKYEYCLLLDSDNYIQQPIIEKMYNGLIENNKMLIGHINYVNRDGIAKGWHYSPEYPIKHYHASLLMIKTEYYLGLRAMGVKFIHHGAAGKVLNEYLHDNKISDVVGITFWDYLGIPDSEVGKYTSLASRGTVSRFGYNL